MNKINKIVGTLGCVLLALASMSNAASVGFQIGTDTVFKNAAGVAFSSTDTSVVAKLGYFASSPGATAPLNESQIIALAASPNSAALNLANSFVALGSIDFGRYVTDTTTSTSYGGSDVPVGTFIRNWDSLSTKPFGFETAGVLNPYLFVAVGSEYLVIKSDAFTLIPSGVDADTTGAWGINALSVVNPDDELDVKAPTAFLVGSLGMFDSASNSFQTVPEPATGLLLLTSGLVAMMLRRTRSSNKCLNS